MTKIASILAAILLIAAGARGQFIEPLPTDREAEWGNVDVQLLLGLTHLTGRTEQVDRHGDVFVFLYAPTEAVRWFKLAAEQGNAEGQYWLGRVYEIGYGWGVEEDPAEALRWYTKAAEQGYAEAQHQRTRLVEARDTSKFIEPLPIDREAEKQIRTRKLRWEEANHYYSRGGAYSHGWGVEEGSVGGVRWYRKAAELGHLGAQYELGQAYYDGSGVQQDYAEAVRWYRHAAQGGHALAQMKLGRIYDDGRGVPQHDIEAYSWYALVKSGGSEELAVVAAKGMDALADGMTPAQIEAAQDRAVELHSEIKARMAKNRMTPAQVGEASIAIEASFRAYDEVKSRMTPAQIEAAETAIEAYIEACKEACKTQKEE